MQLAGYRRESQHTIYLTPDHRVVLRPLGSAFRYKPSVTLVGPGRVDLLAADNDVTYAYDLENGFGRLVERDGRCWHRRCRTLVVVAWTGSESRVGDIEREWVCAGIKVCAAAQLVTCESAPCDRSTRSSAIMPNYKMALTTTS